MVKKDIQSITDLFENKEDILPFLATFEKKYGAAYNEDQPRDENGQWADTGAAPGTGTKSERIMFEPTEKQIAKWVFTEREMPDDEEFKTMWAKKHGGKTNGWGMGKRDWAKTNLAASRDYQIGMWQGRVDMANKQSYHEERTTASYNYGYHLGYTEYPEFRRGIDKKTAEEFDAKYVRKSV